MANDDEEKINEFLLTFVDFLYAVIFGFVLQQLFSEVIFVKEISYPDKAARILLVAGVFYFLTSDWIQARLLTARNPFKRYRRFFLELVIAFAGYGAAAEILRGKAFFLVYIIFILLLGALWSHLALKEYPDSPDRRELNVIQILQPVIAAAGGLVCFLWISYIGNITTLVGAIFLLFIGWWFDFIYEYFANTKIGIPGGPYPFFVSRDRMNKIRSWFNLN